jgi:hypothetical protein
MKNRLALYLLTSVLGTSCLLAACGDDSDDPAGSGGETSAAGQNAGGSSAGKSQGGSAGKAQGGKSGATGGSPSGGAGGDATSSGGASVGGADVGGVNVGGAGGSGGEGAEPLAYDCGTTSINHELCSALSAANCSEPVDCADCVLTRSGDRETFTECPACLAEFDAFLQCGIDAYESGNISAGIECYDGFADLNDACAEHYNSAANCTSYLLEHDCPASWPVD